MSDILILNQPNGPTISSTQIRHGRRLWTDVSLLVLKGVLFFPRRRQRFRRTWTNSTQLCVSVLFLCGQTLLSASSTSKSCEASSLNHSMHPIRHFQCWQGPWLTSQLATAQRCSKCRKNLRSSVPAIHPNTPSSPSRRRELPWLAMMGSVYLQRTKMSWFTMRK
jgi:hypothetical protein